MKSVLVFASIFFLLVGCATSSREHGGEYRVIKGLHPYVEQLLNAAASEGYSFVRASVSSSPGVYVIVQRSSRPVDFEYRVLPVNASELATRLNESAKQGFQILFFTTQEERATVILSRHK